MITRWVGIPETRDVLRFVPTAYNCRPKTVRLNIRWATIARVAHITNGNVTKEDMSPLRLVLPMFRKAGGRLRIFSEWVSAIATALKKLNETSVTMKGGILNRAIAIPFRNPITSPTLSMTRIATGIESG